MVYSVGMCICYYYLCESGYMAISWLLLLIPLLVFIFMVFLALIDEAIDDVTQN